jgi:acetyltransferase-like isoleucine patch superfamily enzyme
MLRLFQSLITFVRLYLMRRRQYENVKLRDYFQDQHDIIVGMYSYGCFDRWRMPGPMRIGRYCSIANTVRVADRNHPIDSLTTHPILYEKALGVVDEDLGPAEPLIIQDDVWIGENVVILPHCKHIGRGAIIGAGSVVTRNVDPYSIVAGNPARKLRDRFVPELVAALEKSRWWQLDAAQLRELGKSSPTLVFRPTTEAVEAWLAETAR